MSLKSVLSSGVPRAVSFEFSPPKTAEAEELLWQAIRKLEPLAPAFVSVTYGAGGSTRERTHATVKRIAEETSLSPAAHLTCVSAPREEIDAIAQSYWDAGVRHIVALRGDMPNMQGRYASHSEGYGSTPEMIAGLRRVAAFEISVSCYPERHPDSPSFGHDLDLLKRKVDAGASRAIGQFCFDTDTVTRLRDNAFAEGIRIPIIPGLMPTTNFQGVMRMASRCGACVPQWLSQLYDGLEQNLESRRIIAAAVMAEQVAELRSRGFDQFHFYTLNQSDLTFAACRLLGMTSAGAA
ncbi:MAG: methylenetetrahydrofolate reductase [NAD(P)H] [Alphaproteobacteria bacterium]|nr:methylenetetrahydrofolate reductase [NAD(P)H] [Alphaproteobacteria bacterium]